MGALSPERPRPSSPLRLRRPRGAPLTHLREAMPVAALALASLLALEACISGSTGETLPSPDPGAIVITAHDIRFDRPSLRLPAGHPIELAFDNLDGVPHNVAVYTDSSAATPLFVGQVFGGPGQRVYQLPELAPGIYYFRCDVHPQMNGTVEVH